MSTGHRERQIVGHVVRLYALYASFEVSGISFPAGQGQNFRLIFGCGEKSEVIHP